MTSDTVTFAGRINGKRSGELVIDRNADAESDKVEALKFNATQDAVGGTTVRKVIMRTAKDRPCR